MKRITALLVAILLLTVMGVASHADEAPAATASFEESSKEISSAEVSEETSSADIAEESSQAVSLGLSSESGNTNGAVNDFALTMIVFAVSSLAIVGIIVFTVKKK